MDSDFERRAAERRGRLSGGVARSFAELEEAGVRYWASATFAERLQATYEAVADSWIIQGKNGTPPRFDGSSWGILKFER
jgi:hypothetical protein